MLACPPEAAPPPADANGLEAGSVRVRLFFGDAADLDLYVTDPFQETVYFANTPARSGGALREDLRCTAAAPRTETVVFPDAPAGRYRVGVDYPERCRRAPDPIPYRIVVEADGMRRDQPGEIGFGHFEGVVIEFDVGTAPRG